ncbi:DUF3010 family protein [Psychromonas sp. SP041]|uniref:DUF3010 family protein n=1 Tax=Psychromonas sp. SP041 TaxID=1365007 RepID=UPI00040A1D3A|nr:DUF3010 family protein [Psychromonas sp. SP041]
MKICGIELKASDAILVVLEADEERFHHVDLKVKKISLGDGDVNADVLSFKEKIDTFVLNNQIGKIFIKKRGKTGRFAGGANTFKMEGLIQLSTVGEVTLISPQTTAAMQKKNKIELSTTLNAYQHDAYLTAVTGMHFKV